MTTTDPDFGPVPDLDLGFTVGLDLPFEETVEWAAGEGFDFVEMLLDGPYARERIAGRRASMRARLDDSGLDVAVHLPFVPDLRSPFAPVREGIVAELVAGMDEPGMAAFCREHADRIGHLHLVDTRGGDDEHLPAGMGRIDFGTVFDGLADAG